MGGFSGSPPPVCRPIRTLNATSKGSFHHKFLIDFSGGTYSSMLDCDRKLRRVLSIIFQFKQESNDLVYLALVADKSGFNQVAFNLPDITDFPAPRVFR